MLVVGPFTPASPAEAAALVRQYLALCDGKHVPPLPMSNLDITVTGVAPGSLGDAQQRRRRWVWAWTWSDDTGGSPPAAGAPVTSPIAPRHGGGAASPAPVTTAAGPAAAASSPTAINAQWVLTKDSTPSAQRGVFTTTTRDPWWLAFAAAADEFALLSAVAGNDPPPTLKS